MKSTKIIGDEGEKRAKQFLIDENYQICTTNYRFKRAEIDLIAQKENELIFIEVKYRKNAFYGFPEIAVTAKKEELIKSAAEDYIFKIDWKESVRFDIIAIVGNQIEHFKDAF